MKRFVISPWRRPVNWISLGHEISCQLVILRYRRLCRAMKTLAYFRNALSTKVKLAALVSPETRFSTSSSTASSDEYPATSLSKSTFKRPGNLPVDTTETPIRNANTEEWDAPSRDRISPEKASRITSVGIPETLNLICSSLLLGAEENNLFTHFNGPLEACDPVIEMFLNLRPLSSTKLLPLEKICFQAAVHFCSDQAHSRYVSRALAPIPAAIGPDSTGFPSRRSFRFNFVTTRWTSYQHYGCCGRNSCVFLSTLVSNLAAYAPIGVHLVEDSHQFCLRPSEMHVPPSCHSRESEGVYRPHRLCSVHLTKMKELFWSISAIWEAGRCHLRVRRSGRTDYFPQLLK
eukprot:284819488_5